jgi:hypothetical protein
MFLNVFQRGILMMFWGSREGLEDFCNSSLCCLSHYYLLFCMESKKKDWNFEFFIFMAMAAILKMIKLSKTCVHKKSGIYICFVETGKKCQNSPLFVLPWQWQQNLPYPFWCLLHTVHCVAYLIIICYFAEEMVKKDVIISE